MLLAVIIARWKINWPDRGACNAAFFQTFGGIVKV
jgi:hypothetical protein